MDMVGKTIAHYEVKEKLGAGGMGIVYKAEDTRLKRTVALKCLPLEMTRDDEYRERFVTEAQAASALEHTNICNIHEINTTDDGQMYICMAFYDGETLKERLQRGPLKIDETIDIAMQVAAGLARAHEKGIVHRDIKPANIMITPDGTVKILDFGVAKLADQTGLTKTGMTMGTVAYMSVEQGRGERVDCRTDIWSLGVMIYEMLTGRQPFRADKAAAVIYSILNEQPEPITGQRTGVPIELERIVFKCLEKNSRDRYRTAEDLLTDLRRLRRDLDSGPTATIAISPHTARRLIPQISRKTWRATGFASAFLAVGAAIAVAVLFLFGQLGGGGSPVILGGAPTPEMNFNPLTGGGGMADFPAWSPDGKWIVYASDEAGSRDIWKRPIEGGRSERLTTDDEADEYQPTWSPDGRTVAYASDRDGGSLFLIPADGGDPIQLHYSAGQPIRGDYPLWAPDGKTIVYNVMGDLHGVPFSGGEPSVVVRGTSGTPFAVWGPEGRRLIYWDRTGGDIHLIELESGEVTPLGLLPSGEEIAGLAWSADGSLLYYCRGPFGGNKSLWRVDIDPASGRPSGEPMRLTNSLTDVVHCSIAPGDGKVAFTVSNLERHLWALRRDPATGLLREGARQITQRGGRNYYPAASPDGSTVIWTSHRYAKGMLYYLRAGDDVVRKLTQDWNPDTREIYGTFSPDGKQVAYATTKNGSYEIWRNPSLGSVGLQVTATEHPVRDSCAAWCPTADRIAIYSTRSGNWDIWLIDLQAGGAITQLTNWETSENYPVWSPDGTRIAFRSDHTGNADIWAVDAAGGEPQPLVSDPAEEGWCAWSPDGRWFYFSSNRSGAFNIWMMPAAGGEAVQVTNGRDLAGSMPNEALYTKFAVTDSEIILPIESQRGDIYLLEFRGPEEEEK